MENNNLLYYGFLVLSSIMGWIVHKLGKHSDEIRDRPTEAKVLQLIDMKQQSLLDRQEELKETITKLEDTIKELNETLLQLQIALAKFSTRN